MTGGHPTSEGRQCSGAGRSMPRALTSRSFTPVLFRCGMRRKWSNIMQLWRWKDVHRLAEEGYLPRQDDVLTGALK